MKQLRSTIRRAKTDESRLAAMKSLKRAKQTHADLQKTNANLDKCKSSLADVTGVLESMHLKMSNLKVNTQKTDLLEELSSDLELEMSALEEALYDVKS
jgi:predicted  nucleic acid-binding Zn-ribbon protein